jgi:UDP-N-acetylglucosamine:LPS N-acetylglucosamine transferase
VGGAGRISIVSASVGAGHDGAAAELARRLTEAGYRVDCHDFLDLLGERAGRALRWAYATELKVAPESWGWLVGNLERRQWLGNAVGALVSRRAMTRAAEAFGCRPAGPGATGPGAPSVNAPDPNAPGQPAPPGGTPPARGPLPRPRVVVSTYHLASQMLGRMRRTGELAAPVVTFLTDLSVHPLWVADGVDLHLALHDVAAKQARWAGADFVDVCSPAVRPEFHPVADPGEAARTRARYRLPPTGRLALVVAGSWGVGQVAEATADLAATGLVTPVTVCGRNEHLRERLTRAGTGVALGWVDQMPELIRASDVVVQNAGGLTSLEAMACGVPVLTYRCLPGHGTTNAQALHDAGLARWVRDPAELGGVLAGLLDGDAGRRQRTVAGDLFRAPSAVDAILALAAAYAEPFATGSERAATGSELGAAGSELAAAGSELAAAGCELGAAGSEPGAAGRAGPGAGSAGDTSPLAGARR